MILAFVMHIVMQHVLTWAYWGQPDEDPALNASWLMRHVDYLETNATLGARFRAAGGKYVIAYTDPVKVITARHEPLWDVGESGWFHGPSGARVGRQFGDWGVQQLLNPASPLTLAAFEQLTRSIRDNPPGVFTNVLVDDLSWDLRNVFYQADSQGVEVSSDDEYDRAAMNLLRHSALPVFFNGLGNQDEHVHDISGDVIFLPYAQGGMHEGCFYDVDGPRSGEEWRFDANTLLYTTGHGKKAVCLDNTSNQSSVPARTYYLASWWLTYDPRNSIAFPNLPSPGEVRVFPEFSIVPTHPLQTAHANIDELNADGGAYAREFAACYQNGDLIGQCAAVVNPSNGTVTVPGWAAHYSETLHFDANNSFDGGRAWWERTAIPRQLAPGETLVLLQPIKTR